MTPEAQRIAIAEACGWKVAKTTKFRVFGNPDDEYGGCSACHDHWGTNTVGHEDWIPDYLNDLNAMHEAEKVLGQLRSGIYTVELRKIISKFNSEPPYVNSFEWHATAAQRAEAFLRTLGLWKDSSVSEDGKSDTTPITK